MRQRGTFFMRNLTLICPGGFKDTMKSLQFSLPSILHIVLISLLTLFLNRCDSSNGSKPQLKEIQKITPLVLRTIPHDNQAFTQGLLTGIFGNNRIDDQDQLLHAEGGYVRFDNDDKWWIPSGKIFFYEVFAK